MKPWVVWVLDPRPPLWRSMKLWLIALIIVAFWSRDEWWAASGSGGAVSWFVMSDGSVLTWEELTDADRAQTVSVKQQMSVDIGFEARQSDHADAVIIELGDVFADPSRSTRRKIGSLRSVLDQNPGWLDVIDRGVHARLDMYADDHPEITDADVDRLKDGLSSTY